MLYETGTKFMFSGQLYILAQVDYCKFAMIGVHNGNRYNDPIEIEHPNADSEEFSVGDHDIDKMFNYNGYNEGWVAICTENAKALYERRLVDELRNVYNRIGEYIKDER